MGAYQVLEVCIFIGNGPESYCRQVFVSLRVSLPIVNMLMEMLVPLVQVSVEPHIRHTKFPPLPHLMPLLSVD